MKWRPIWSSVAWAARMTAACCAAAVVFAGALVLVVWAAQWTRAVGGPAAVMLGLVLMVFLGFLGFDALDGSAERERRAAPWRTRQIWPPEKDD
jgi:hypothetical protein